MYIYIPVSQHGPFLPWPLPLGSLHRKCHCSARSREVRSFSVTETEVSQDAQNDP